MNIHDIVQIDPSMDAFGGCFAVVHELKGNGRLMVYVQSAGIPGQQFLFVNKDQYRPTGGKAVWVIEESSYD